MTVVESGWTDKTRLACLGAEQRCSLCLPGRSGVLLQQLQDLEIGGLLQVADPWDGGMSFLGGGASRSKRSCAKGSGYTYSSVGQSVGRSVSRSVGRRIGGEGGAGLGGNLAATYTSFFERKACPDWGVDATPLLCLACISIVDSRADQRPRLRRIEKALAFVISSRHSRWACGEVCTALSRNAASSP